MATASEAGIYEFRVRMLHEDGSIEVEYDQYFINDHEDLVQTKSDIAAVYKKRYKAKQVDVTHKYLCPRNY